MKFFVIEKKRKEDENLYIGLDVGGKPMFEVKLYGSMLHFPSYESALKFYEFCKDYMDPNEIEEFNDWNILEVDNSFTDKDYCTLWKKE